MSDVAQQTREALERIDRELAQLGTDKSKILTAQVRLADLDLRDAVDAVWNDWIDPQHPPLRVHVLSELRPRTLVEIMVTAVK
jgi:enamine deaminase RidA (YjgF/YER057c/UK114 family)